MKSIIHLALLIVPVFSLSSSSCTSECPEGDNADSLFCHNSSSIAPEEDAGGLDSCDDPNETLCEAAGGNVCVDIDTDKNHCGVCGNACDANQGCANGECVDQCDSNQVLCGGNCIDPLTDGDFCGASGDCEGANQGDDCDATQVCAGGSCVAAKRYLGSLPPTQGRWQYGGVLGLDGAIAQCQAIYLPTAQICTFDMLLDAQARGELVNATDNLNAPVDSWFIDDPNDNLRRCVKTDGENIPWTYPTADLGQGSKFVTLDAVNGTISAVQELGPDATLSCGASRFVACCDPQ